MKTSRCLLVMTLILSGAISMAAEPSSKPATTQPAAKATSQPYTNADVIAIARKLAVDPSTVNGKQVAKANGELLKALQARPLALSGKVSSVKEANLIVAGINRPTWKISTNDVAGDFIILNGNKTGANQMSVVYTTVDPQAAKLVKGATVTLVGSCTWVDGNLQKADKGAVPFLYLSMILTEGK